MTVPAAFSEMFQHVLALEGRTVLYVEQMNLFRIIVSEVRAREDGQGFESLATFLPTHGMACKQESWRFGAGWEWFFATPQKVNLTYGGWRIYTESDVMDEALAILKSLPEGQSYLSDYHWVPIHGNPKVTAKGIPGPIAIRILEFLRHH